MRIAAHLGIDQDAVVGKLMRLWVWADQNSVDGNGVTVTSAFLDRITFCPNFAQAMRDVGWLIGSDGSLTLPNFGRHNGKTAKERAVSNRRVTKHRNGNGESNENETVDVTPAPLQKPLPEKRREDKKEQKTTDAEASVVPGKPATPPCPHAEIVNLYHEVLPSLTAVHEWNDKRQAYLRKRWSEKPERQSLDWWRGFFAYVAESDFLMGRTAGRGGEPFRCDLEWLVRPTNFLKVVEGRYENRGPK